MMFKIMVLQALYSLSDDQAESQILPSCASWVWVSATVFPTPRRSICSAMEGLAKDVAVQALAVERAALSENSSNQLRYRTLFTVSAETEIPECTGSNQR